MFKLPVEAATISLQRSEQRLNDGYGLWLVLGGELGYEGELGECILRQSDVVFLGDGERVNTRPAEGNTILSLRFDPAFFCECMESARPAILCNSALRTGDYPLLRQHISVLAEAYFSGDNAHRLHLLALCYELLDVLRTCFSVAGDGGEGTGERKYDIERYMRRNYRQPLTLQSLAAEFHMSPQYLSRFFKKSFGEGFLSYLTALRLDSAVRELEAGEGTVTQVVFNNGFPNVSSFNRVFRERYGATPKEYLRQRRDTGRGGTIEVLDNQIAMEGITRYLPVGDSRAAEPALMLAGEADCGVSQPFAHTWNRIINLEHAVSCLQTDFQQQLSEAQRQLHFEYARLIGLISDDVFPGIWEQGLASYTSLNRIIDFLLSIKLKPFIELQPKPVKKGFGNGEMLLRYERETIPDAQWNSLMQEFFAYLVKRWGEDEVETWRFELWIPQNEELEVSPGGLQRYCRTFRSTEALLKGYAPGARLGGPGINMGGGSMETFEQLLGMMKAQGIQPDFLSMYLYPNYIAGSVGPGRLRLMGMMYSRQETQRKKAESFVSAVHTSGLEVTELFITEFGSDISSRAPLNDGSYKSAYIAKTVLDCSGLVDGMGYWHLSDLSYEDMGSNQLLYGGNGLFSRNGIKKSAYHAFWLLGKLGKRVVSRAENYIVTMRNSRHYEILVHNYKGLSEDYCLRNFREAALPEDKQLFDDLRPLELSLTLARARLGDYMLKEYRLGENMGNLSTALQDLNCRFVLREEENKYLAHVSVPRQRIEYGSSDGTIPLSCHLLPGEVVLYTLVFEE